MKYWKILIGGACFTLTLGAVIILSAGGVWGEGKVTPGLTAPRPKLNQEKANPADSTAKSMLPEVQGVWKKLDKKHSGGSMPEYKPDPNVDHKILVRKPDPNINYTMRVIPPASSPDHNAVTPPNTKNLPQKVWKSVPGGKLPDSPGQKNESPDTDSPKSK